MDKRRAPHAPARTVWRPLGGHVYHLQKAQPDAGRWRIWRLQARAAIAARTVGRIRALLTRVYHDIPHGPTAGGKPPSGPHPYHASPRQPDGFIDGRRMAGALDGGRWGSLSILEGSARPMRAGMIAPTAATGGALMVLYPAWLRSGAPVSLIADRGGASTAAAVEAVCTRRQLQQEPIVSTPGESAPQLMETPFNSQRRLDADPCSRARPPAELEPRPQACIHT